MRPAWLSDPRIVAALLVLLTMFLTAGARMSMGVWMFLLVAVFFAGWKATELFQAGAARYR